MSNILFIEKQMPIEKLGIMYLSAYLKEKGHNTTLAITDNDDIYETIERFNPDFFAYSCCTGEHRHALETNRKLKKEYPHILSIFGGAHTTFFPEIILEKGVDFGVIGQGEEAFIDIIEGRADKLVKKPLFSNLNELPLPDRDIIYQHKHLKNNPIKNIITQRDCPYDCSYCHNHLNRIIFKDEKNKMFQRKSVDYVMGEIDDLQRFPLERILFIDDNFLGKQEWLDEFCTKYKEVGLPFVCCMRANQVTEEKVKQLKDAGLSRVHISIESADQSVQRIMLNRGRITNNDVKRSIELFKKYNIMVRLQQMIGLPLEDPLKDALNTLQFSLDNKPDESWVTLFQPYPRTQLGEYCQKWGYVTGNLEDACSENYHTESRLEIKDKDKIQRLHRWWHFIVKHDLPMDFVNILLNIPLSKESMDKMTELRIDDYKDRLIEKKEEI